MAKFRLLMLEVGGIQDFIYGSNNLRVNVGASALIKAITVEWVAEFLAGQNHNIDNGEAQECKGLEKDSSLDVEAIYIGGGNALLMFRDHFHIQSLVRGISARLLQEAPALQVVIAEMDIEWETEALTNTLKELRKNLARQKRQPPANLPLPGLGVTTACVFTGQPAAYEWRDPSGQTKLISFTVDRCRGEYFEKAERELQSLFPEAQEAGLSFVSDFDDFSSQDKPASPNESSYIAVVHADGNRMGERIKELAKGCNTPDKNREYAQKLWAFSNSARSSAKEALRSTVLRLMACKQRDEKTGKWYWQRRTGVNPANRRRLPIVVCKENTQGSRFLPFRPVVFGGDDVTFVCHGRLGLALAQHYLTDYGNRELVVGFKQNGFDEAKVTEKAVGRAGVAIVHTHFPFAQAYGLAEDLAKSAKLAGENGHAASMDWHFGVNGVVETLGGMRDLNYQVVNGRLYARPIRLTTKSPTPRWQTWDTFEQIVTEFQIGNKWRTRRNKLKALQTALRGGDLYTRSYLKNNRLPPLPKPEPIENYADVEWRGWLGSGWPDAEGATCVYFDALEALDFYVPLEDGA